MTDYQRHRYGTGRRRNICIRCGVRRRYHMSDWEWFYPNDRSKPRDVGHWLTRNPACIPTAAR